jgi:hypothetical protein
MYGNQEVLFGGEMRALPPTELIHAAVDWPFLWPEATKNVAQATNIGGTCLLC